jgi:hypothetical protein
LKLFTAIVEQNVTYNSPSGTIMLQNVLRRFENPSGKYIEDLLHFEYTYNLNNETFNPDNLIVVTFVQDELTKEILQTATNDTTTNPVVSITDWFAKNEILDMLIFPNPAAAETYLVFSEKPMANSFVEILNQQGKVIQLIKPTEEQQLKVDLQSVVQGIYFVKWVNNDRQVVKKLVITQ